MYFPVKFTRTVSGGTGTLSPATSAPTGRPTEASDNQLLYKCIDIDGWPVHRIAVVYGGTGSATITADCYFYEENTATWYKVNGASPSTLNKGCVSFFDVPTSFTQVTRTSNPNPPAGNGAVALVPITGGLADGTYTFALAPDLTTFG
jgi:hypothetical protein